MRPPRFGFFLAVAAGCSLLAAALELTASAPAGAAVASLEGSAHSAETPIPSTAPASSVTETSPATGEVLAAESFRPLDKAVASATAVPTPVTEAPELVEAPQSRVPVLPDGVAIPVEHQPIAEFEQDLFEAMNTARAEEGLDVLARNAELDGVALARARNLAELDYFDHYAPDGTSAFSELAARGLPYRIAGENLARNNYPASQTVDAAFAGLMASPGHRANILEPRFGAVGVAAIRDGGAWLYVTVFTNPR